MARAQRSRAPGPVSPEDGFRSDVLAGLRRRQKTLPCKYLYDAIGAKLFDRICTLDEYYPTRTELAIMEQDVQAMAEAAGPEAAIVELGSGSGLKTRVLLEHLERPRAYVPVDIAREHLYSTAQTLQEEFPDVRVAPVWADYTQPFNLPPEIAGGPLLVYFPGSTIGNFDRCEAQAFLRRIAKVLGPDGGLLIGVDLKKDRLILERAYDDSQGVTAAFNLNLLARINRELEGEFPLERFVHHAPYNIEEGRIEMHLVSLDTRHVRVAGEIFRFNSGESIWTESSHKYSPGEFARLAVGAGLTVERFWSDPKRLFSVQYLRAAGSG